MHEQEETRLFVDGQDFKYLVGAALAWLRHHQEAINALNVFPVPDGDTGTNMVLTMQSAWDEAAEVQDRHVGVVAHKVAHGALMGARGNSGVILSQIWRGMARKLDGKEVMAAADLAAAVDEGARTAYKGVLRPVEGTILTVIREVAREAGRAAGGTDDLLHVLERMVHQARTTVVHTPDLLPVLAEAGVVDAGGQGLYVILEGMMHYLRGESVGEELALDQPSALPGMEIPAEDAYGYDVQFLILGQNLDVEAIHKDIDAMGDCALVVGEPTTVKVHVHVPDPGVPLSYAVKLGSLADVVVEDMQAQYQQFTRERQGIAAPAAVVRSEIGVVAVAAGDGLARVLESLGAAAVVRGGQTMNPSTEEILRAVESVPAEKVIVLPNNKNIIMAAHQAGELSSRPVAVVPTRTIPQGIAALLVLNYQADLETNAREMIRAAQEVQTGEVTTATRSVTLNGVVVREGQIIGIHDGELCVSGDSPTEVVGALTQRMGVAEREIVTLYYGADVSPEEVGALVAGLRTAYPGQEFEVIEGGQPHYFYLISAE